MKKTKRELLVLAAATTVALSMGVTVQAKGDEKVLNFGCQMYTDGCVNSANDENSGWNAMRYGIAEALFKFDDNMEVIPWLAESYEVNDEHTEWTIKLKDGIKFSDGCDLTPTKVKEYFDHMKEVGPSGSAKPEKYLEFEAEVTVDDDANTINIKTSKPYANLVGQLCHPTMGITDVEHIENYDNGIIGTGPYKIESWDEGQAITLVKNEDYFKGEPSIDKIVFKIVPDDNAKALQLKSGELDLALLTPKDAAAFADDEAYTCYDMKTSDYRGIMFNFGNEYWQKNRDLIPAVCYGLDRQAIIDAVILGQGMPAYGPLQRNVYNYEDVEHYDYNPEKAKEILEAAGCEMGDDGFYYRDGEKVGFVISVSAGDQVRIDMAQIAAQELKEIGMDVSVEIPAQTDWAGQMAFLIGWGSPFDADDHTYKVFGTDKGANYSGYSNADVDKYLTEARQSADPEVRAEAYANFQKALAEDPAYAMICYIDANYVADSNIKGIDPDTIMGHHGVGIFWNVADWTIE
mgnify:FL=1